MLRILFAVPALVLLLSTTIDLAEAQTAPTASASPAPARDLGEIRTQSLGAVAIRVAVPDPEQTRKIFGVKVQEKGIQPVWVEITNGRSDAVYFLPITTDPAYYSPLEVAFRFHDRLSSEETAARNALFLRESIATTAGPGQTISGFVFTHLETGLKFITVGILAGDQRVAARFVVPVGGPGFAIENVDFAKIVPAGSEQEVDLASLRKALSEMPCCTRNKEGTGQGDPLNVVLVGKGSDISFALVQRGWHFTQSLDLRTAAETAAAFVLRLDDQVSPVSPLYVFGRSQDVAMQKARNTINERNHMRLWMTPLRFQGLPVWIGQISRDIGVELTDKSWYGTTHKIDAMVDFDRDYLLQDLMMSGSLSRFGYVGGVGVSLMSNPRFNLEHDPYITDGLRLIGFIQQDAPVTIPVQVLDWDRPAR